MIVILQVVKTNAQLVILVSVLLHLSHQMYKYVTRLNVHAHLIALQMKTAMSHQFNHRMDTRISAAIIFVQKDPAAHKVIVENVDSVGLKILMVQAGEMPVSCLVVVAIKMVIYLHKLHVLQALLSVFNHPDNLR